MERLAELISKLKEQFEQNADASKLLGITLLIERELMKRESAQTPASSSSKVSVVMPAARNGYTSARQETVVETAPELPAQPVQQKKQEKKPMSQK